MNYLCPYRDGKGMESMFPSPSWVHNAEGHLAIAMPLKRPAEFKMELDERQTQKIIKFKLTCNFLITTFS